LVAPIEYASTGAICLASDARPVNSSGDASVKSLQNRLRQMGQFLQISNTAALRNYPKTNQLPLNISGTVYARMHINTYLLPATSAGNEQPFMVACFAILDTYTLKRLL
jgi:hypothetical protein